MKLCPTRCGRLDSKDGKYQHRCVVGLGHEGPHLFLCSNRTPWPEVARLRGELKAIRTQVLNRDIHTCQACGSVSPPGLEVDHIVQLRNGGTNDLGNLWSLCRECHSAKSHTGRSHNPRVARIAARLRDRGFIASYEWCPEGGGHHHLKVGLRRPE